MDKNYYITTPIYYPSAKPHMGHAYSSITADFFARFKKIEGYNVFFLTGTDEHGQKIQKEAEKNNKDPKNFCDEISDIFRSLTKTLNLTNNDFIRTTEIRHFKSVRILVMEVHNSVPSSRSKSSVRHANTWQMCHRVFGNMPEIVSKHVWSHPCGFGTLWSFLCQNRGSARRPTFKRILTHDLDETES